MKRQLATSCIAMALASYPLNCFAQGYLTDNNTVNAVLTRDPARQASTEIDAVFTNPAGTAFLNKGWHISLNGMASFQKMENKPADYLSVYESNETRIIPGIQLAYKTGKWAFSGSFASEGGYGRRTSDGGYTLNRDLFTDGDDNSLDELFLNMIVLQAYLHVINNNYPLDLMIDDKIDAIIGKTKSHQYNWATRIGASYQITNKLSVYVGAKLNYYSDKINNTCSKLMVSRPSTGEQWELSDYLGRMQSAVEDADIDAEKKDGLISSFEAAKELCNVPIGSISTTGWGVAPIIGVDFKTGDFNFGAKYEFASKIGDIFEIPAVLSLGANWQAMQKLKVALGSNINFSENGSAYSKVKVPTSWDISASLNFNFNKDWLVSTGYTFCETSLSSYPFNGNYNNTVPYHRFSIGGAWNATDFLKINLGFSIDSPYNINTTYTGTVEGKNEQSYKPKMQVALGLDFSI